MAESRNQKAREAREKKRAEARKRQQEAKAKAEAQKKSEEQKAAARERTRPRNDWTEDLGGLVKTSGKAVGDAAKATAGALVNEDAWKRLMPGGEKARASDFANAALDASLLIPGAGIAGLAARGGAKALLKTGGREAAERTLSPLAARVAAQGAGGGARKLGAEGAEQTAQAAGRHAATKPGARKLVGATGTARKDAGEALARVGTASERAGRGTKIGMAQSGKRLAANTVATVGANLLTEAYDSGFGTRAPEGGPAKAPAGGVSGVGNGVGVAAGMPGMYALMAADGTLGPTAPSAQQAIASYMNMGGSPDGSQVIYLGR